MRGPQCTCENASPSVFAGGMMVTSKKGGAEMATLPATGFIRQAQLLGGTLPFSASTLWRKVRAGEFPAPVKLSAGVTAWKVEDVRAWMDGRSSEPHASVSNTQRQELPMK